MKIYETLEEQLKTIPELVEENGELKKWVIVSKAQNNDAELIGKLLEDDDLKSKFFDEVKTRKGTALVFNQTMFVEFLEQKKHLKDSYTKFGNKVGLTIGGQYMKQRNEVALVWPYKDCVLEGGQSREEDKRDEIFFNELLAQDEITQLLEPKVITNAKRHSDKGSKPLNGFKRDAEINSKRGLPEDTITDNLIIKGNNLLALHSLEKEFAGKVKLIYIDPPYNTGNDSFKYNDNFNHSTWLTFMRNRLLIAKDLLRDDGSLFLSIDDREFAHLKLVADEVFLGHNFLNDIIWNSTKSVTNTAIVSVSHNHTLVYMKNLDYFVKNRFEFRLRETGEGFSNPDNDPRGPWKADPFQVGGWRKNQQYTIKNPKTAVEYKPNEGSSWKNDFINYNKLIKDNRIVFGVDGKAGPQRKRFLSEALKRGKVAKTIWDDVGTTTNGTQHIKKLFGKGVFPNPKPETLIQRIIELSTREGDIVLDYHIGSGTTASVAHKMQRQYIGIEQLNYVNNVTIERMKKVIAGEQGGISESVNWQGGGEFVYFELKKYNEEFMDRIEAAKDSKQILRIWEDMKKRSFLNYNVDLKKHEESLKDFKVLSIKDQKKHLAGLLDKNQLYVNLSSLNDKDFACTDEEKKLTKDFYKIKK